MAFEIELLIVIVGILYGYLKPGKEDRTALLKKGLLIGLILAIILVALSAIAGWGFLLFGSVLGIFVFIEVILLAVLFIIGTFIGDWAEEKSKSKAT